MSGLDLHTFLPHLDQFRGLLCVLIVSAGFAALGAWVGGARRFAASDVFVGWGVAVAAFILVGTATRLPFTWIAGALLVGAVACAALAWRRDRGRGIDPGAVSVLWRILLVAAPLLLMLSAMKASQWDEFSHWLPNARFALRFDSFPRADLPPSPSALPAYPYALPIVVYLASRLAGAFVENAGALFNTLLLLFYAPGLIFVMRRGLGLGDAPPWRWGGAALGILGVTVLSTTFIQKLVFTTYADGTAAVVLATAGLLAWRILEALAAPDREAALKEARSIAWQCGLVIALLVNVKQTTLILVLSLMGGMVLVAWRDPVLHVRDLIALAPRLLAPGALVYMAWRVHVARHMPGGEVHFQPMARWLLPQAFQILGHMLLILSKKGAYLAMMTGMTVCALRALWRVRGSFDRLALLVGAVFLGHNFFLWVTYITAFGPGGVVAVSFWRFNTHLGLLGCTGAAYGIALLWRRTVAPRLGEGGRGRRVLAVCAALLIAAAPLALHGKVRFDLRPQKDDVRLAGRDLAHILPEGARVGVVDPNGNGFVAKLLNYEMTSGPGAGRHLSTVSAVTKAAHSGSVAAMQKRIRSLKLPYLWVHQPLPKVEAALGVSLPSRAASLLRNEDGRWVLVRAWPYRGYDDPFDEDLPR